MHLPQLKSEAGSSSSQETGEEGDTTTTSFRRGATIPVLWAGESYRAEGEGRLE